MSGDKDGFDVVLEKVVSSDLISKSIADSYSIEQQEVVVEKFGESNPLPDSVKVLCHFNEVRSEFRTHLSIYVLDAALNAEKFAVTQKIADALSMRCLVPDSGPNPYAMFMFSPGMKVPIEVWLSAEDYDECIFKVALSG